MTFSPNRRHRHRRLLILARQQEMRARLLGRTGLAHLHAAIEFGRPLNWVFTGERLPLERGESTLPEALSRTLRDRFDRPDDTTVDSTQRDDSLSTLESQLDQRVLKHDPGLVVLTVGLSDACIEQRLLDSQALGRVLAVLEKQQIVPVVVPPPGYLDSTDYELQRRWRSDVVEMASSRDVVLVPTDTCFSISAVGKSLVTTIGLDQPIGRTSNTEASAPREILSISG